MTLTFIDLVARYWRFRKRDVSPNTYNDYDRTFRRFAQHLENNHIESVDCITTATVEDYLNALHEAGLASKTMANHWTALSALWTYAETKHDIPHIIRDKIPLPRVHQADPVPYTELEVKALIRATAYNAPWRGRPETASARYWALRDKAIIITLVDTGLRATELCDLTITDLDIDQGQLNVRHGKGDRQRFVPIGNRATDAIQDYLDARRRPRATKRRSSNSVNLRPDDPLFATRDSEPLNRTELLDMITATAARAEPPVRGANVHRFRHTFAINYLRRYPNIFTLQKVLGHTSLDSTRRYLKVAQVDILDAHRTASVADNWRL